MTYVHSTRSLPVGTRNTLLTTFVPGASGRSPIYEFCFPQLDLKVIVEIVRKQ
jgi:hypothetical protein